MAYILGLLIIMPIIGLLILLSLPYQAYFVLAVLTFFLGRNAFLGIIFLILGFVKYKNRINIKNNFKFHYKNFEDTNFDFNQFRNEYTNGYNRENFNFEEPVNYRNEYENACETIGVSINDSYDNKKKKYLKLVKKYHPDLNKTKEAEEELKKINRAWDIIEKNEK